MSVAGVVLRAARAGDLDALRALEAGAGEGGWTPGQLADSLVRHRVLVALDGTQMVGYAAFQRILDEAELLNIRVAPAYRRRGVGRCLLAACRTDLEGARCLHLEVRANNWAALALYREAGFAQVGVRRGYYPAVAGGREDALLLRLDLVAVT
jgi:ribosomal-protein-alanine N-acetyltransferase